MTKHQTIYLQAVSPTVSALRADMIFGQLCWQIKYQLGEKKLTDFLQFYREEEPIFILSDVWEADYLPLPLNLNSRVSNQAHNKEQINQMIDVHKKLKKLTTGKISILEKIFFAGENAYHDLWLYRSQGESLELQTKNIIDRQTYQVQEGGVFTQPASWTNKKQALYLKIFDETQFAEYQIQALLELLFTQIGIGAKKSTGAGLFTFEWTDDCFYQSYQGEVSLLLSHAVLAKTEIDLLSESIYRIESKYGKLGEESALTAHPFKQPLLQLKPGSILPTKKEYLGQMENLIAEKKHLSDYNYGFLIPWKV